jgi:hypothetical protein
MVDPTKVPRRSVTTVDEYWDAPGGPDAHTQNFTSTRGFDGRDAPVPPAHSLLGATALAVCRRRPEQSQRASRYRSMPSLRSSTIAALRQRTVSGEKGSMKGIPFCFRSGLPSRRTR